MTKMTQKEAVFQAVKNVLGSQEGAYNPSKEQRSAINAILFEGFKEGKIELGRVFDDSELKNYVSGVLSNWLRKDTRLNGGMKYVSKNPGSRAGSGDEQLKELKKLLSTVTTDEEKAEIQTYIDARLTEINASKKKSVVINYSALPADLAAKFSK